MFLSLMIIYLITYEIGFTRDKFDVMRGKATRSLDLLFERIS